MDEKKMTPETDNHLAEGTLLALLDGDPAADHRRIETHLEQCPVCRARYERLEAERDRVQGALAALEPARLETGQSGRALARLNVAITQYEEKPMLNKIGSNQTARRWLAAAAAVVVVVGLLALPPVRAAARDFLSLFRVEQFVAVDVDMDQIEALAEALESSGIGEDGMLTNIPEPVEAASVAEAAAVAGFTPRQPAGYGAPSEIRVSGPSTSTFTPDVEMLRGVFTAMELDPALLPDNIDGKPFNVTVPGSVMMYYEGDPDYPRDDLVVTQTLAPSVEVPDGVDVDALGMAMLQLLGMDERDAARLSQQIDWTTTLVLPIPSEIATVGEVQVDGTTGLMFDESSYEEAGSAGMVIWQNNGVVTVVAGADSSSSLLAAANALQ